MRMASLVSAAPAPTLRDRLDRLIEVGFLPLTIACLILGAILHVAGAPAAGDLAWGFATAVSAVILAVGIVEELLEGRTGVDVVALLAMVGSVLLGEMLAGAVIAVMFATGTWLEAFAEGRAERELSALLARSPGVAHRYDATGSPQTVPASDVREGDRLLVKPGEVVPVDGLVLAGSAALDESAVTGESRVVVREASDAVVSGVVNVGGPFDLLATATADGTTVHGDPLLLHELAANLVDNALRWSPEGAVVIRAHHSRARVQLLVIDHGPGIPPSRRRTVLQPFNRLDDSATGGGLGLGLAIADRLVEAMGGDLELRDTPGGGLTVVVSLPVSAS